MRKLSFAIAGLLTICASAQSPLDDFKEKLREGFDSFAAGNRKDYERF